METQKWESCQIINENDKSVEGFSTCINNSLLKCVKICVLTVFKLLEIPVSRLHVPFCVFCIVSIAGRNMDKCMGRFCHLAEAQSSAACAYLLSLPPSLPKTSIYNVCFTGASMSWTKIRPVAHRCPGTPSGWGLWMNRDPDHN